MVDKFCGKKLNPIHKFCDVQQQQQQQQQKKQEQQQPLEKGISSEQVDLTNIDLEHVDPKPNDNLLTTPIKKLSIEKLESILINNNPDLLAETSYEPIITKLFTTVGDSSSGKNNKKADNDLNDFIPIIKNTESHIKANDIDDDDDDDDEDDVDDDELKEISKQVKCVGVGNDDADADAIYDEDDIVKIKQIYNTAQLNPPKRSTTEDIVFNQYRSETSAPRVKKRPTKEMLAAQKVINDSLQKSLTQQQQQQQHNNNNNHLKNANQIVQKEWFNISSTDIANPLDVEDYLDCFEEFSNQLLKYMVNLIDFNGNTAMHYAVSHGNFDVVSILLDSKVCNVNQTNNAGYTCVMLVSLAKLKLSAHHTVVKRLFQMSDVNIRAKKHCQTALMLAVSHGNLDMVQMLLEAGADINIQDEDGSTSLMCAAEHGRIDIVKLLLAQPDCDSSIQDVDGSTALKISLEAGFRDIGVLLYAHEHMSRNRSPYTSLRRNKKAVAAAAVASSSGSTKTQKKLSPASTPCSPVPSMKFHHQQHHHYQR